MKIAIFDVKDYEIPVFKRKLKGHTLKLFSDSLTDKNVSSVKGYECVSGFVYSKLDKNVLAKLPRLRLIATRSTGFDHIDLQYCKERNITVTNVPFYGENTVAEHVFALILSISRNVHKSYVRTLRNDFSIEGLKGFDIKGKTLGVIGAGRIGMHVVKIARGFGMNVLASDTHRDEFMEEALGFMYVSLEELMKKSDIISVNVPYNRATHHMINARNLKLVKKGVIIINTSRGGIIDTEALIKALDKGLVGGAGLDVLEGEDLMREEKQLLYDQKSHEELGNLIKDHILLSKDNVVFTPHIAFYSQEALMRILETTIENIEKFAAKKPQNVVRD